MFLEAMYFAIKMKSTLRIFYYYGIKLQLFEKLIFISYLLLSFIYYKSVIYKNYFFNIFIFRNIAIDGKGNSICFISIRINRNSLDIKSNAFVIENNNKWDNKKMKGGDST